MFNPANIIISFFNPNGGDETFGELRQLSIYFTPNNTRIIIAWKQTF